MVIAIVTAIGGGTLRDLLLGATPVFWVRDPAYVAIAALAALVVLAAARQLGRRRSALLVADAFGLALFSVLGAREAVGAGAEPAIAVVMGVLTAVAGGLMRDILCAEVPLILRREIYATAALAGAGMFVALTLAGAGRDAALWGGVAVGLGLRLAAIRWGFSLPVFALRDG